MSQSDEIRELARQGLPTAEIARRLGIRYQTARSVLISSDQHVTRANGQSVALSQPKPPLTTIFLTQHGFAQRATWQLNASTMIELDSALSKEPGVYAFAIKGIVQYVGLASRGIAGRLYSYTRPGASQRTNVRLNSKISDLLATGTLIEIFVAHPTDGDWNGMRLSGPQGLEAALIADYELPWNRRGG